MNERTVTLASPTRQALIWAVFGFLVGAATTLMQLLVTLSLNPVTDLNMWGISAGAAVLAAGIGYSLPYLKAVLPPPPA